MSWVRLKEAPTLGHCAIHGKVLQGSRKEARRLARRDGGRMSVYVCGEFPGYHIGHLPPGVKAGIHSRDTLRGAS